MNRRLVLYFDTDFLMAGVKPYDTFLPLTVREMTRLPLFFFVDPDSSQVQYGERYRHEYEDGQPGTYGNLLHSLLADTLQFRVFQYTAPVVELLKTVMDDVRRQYLSLLGTLTSSLDLSVAVPVSVVYSDNVPDAARTRVADYLKRIGYEVDAAAYVPAEMLVLSLLENGKLAHPAHRQVLVADAFNDHLNYALVQAYNATAVERTARHTYPMMGVDSRVSVVARHAVDYINRQRRLLDGREEVEKETRRHFRMAAAWVRQLAEETRPFLDVESDFAIERGVKNKVVLRKDDIEQQVTYHVRTLGQTLDQFLATHNTRPEDVDRIVFAGESLRSSRELQLEFSRFGPQKVYFCAESDETGLLNGVFLRRQQHEKPAPPPPPAPGPAGAATPPQGFETVVVTAQLAVGQQLELGWNDRLVRVLHVGGGSFVVVQNHLSQLLVGDRFSIDTLLLGQRPVFRQMVHAGKPTGDYTPSGQLNVLKKV